VGAGGSWWVIHVAFSPQKQKDLGCPGSSPRLVDFGLAVAVAVVATFARDLRCGLRPKVLVQRTKGTTSSFSEQTAFLETQRKVHATLATAAKDATESPLSCPRAMVVPTNTY